MGIRRPPWSADRRLKPSSPIFVWTATALSARWIHSAARCSSTTRKATSLRCSAAWGIRTAPFPRRRQWIAWMTGCWCSTADAASLSALRLRPTGMRCAGRPCCTMTASLPLQRRSGRMCAKKTPVWSWRTTAWARPRLGRKIMLPPCVIFAFPRTGRIMPRRLRPAAACCCKSGSR